VSAAIWRSGSFGFSDAVMALVLASVWAALAAAVFV